VQIVKVSRDLIVSNRYELKDACLVAAVEDPTIVLDASDTRYIDASGFGVIVSVSKRLKEQGGSLRVRGLNPDLLLMFELFRLEWLVEQPDPTPEVF
jgi:anti-sigma B factor antagonist